LADVFIVGGGPAGAAAARLLASWGFSVLLAHRPAATPHLSLAESLPPSTRKLLEFIGFAAAVDSAAFHPNFGNISRWAERRHSNTTDASGYHVPRARFDAVLRRAAVAAGARIIEAVVRRVDIATPSRVEYVGADGATHTVAARFVLDCSGRAGVVARRGWRRTEAAYRTMAIAAEWESSEWTANEQAHTIVESYGDGWAWSVPVSPTRRQFTVMIDQRRGRRGCGERRDFSPASGISTPSDTYARELAKTIELSARLRHARQTSRPWICDASVYDAVRAADPGVLLVGDAASFIEPLSSAGVKKALTSAWRAAVVVNTCLSRPDMSGASLAYFSEREHAIYTDCRRRSASFFREAAVAHADPFWSARADGLSREAEAPIENEQTLASDAAVRAAFDTLRSAPRVRLRPATTVRVEAVATIEGREVVMRDAVVLPRGHRPLRYAAGVDLPALVGLTAECDDMSSLISVYRSRIGPIPVEQLLTGVSLLVAERALVNESSAGSSS
jgi:flavin-dependent dehydrogenase